jgi:hypothetical protein
MAVGKARCRLASARFANWRVCSTARNPSCGCPGSRTVNCLDCVLMAPDSSAAWSSHRRQARWAANLSESLRASRMMRMSMVPSSWTVQPLAVTTLFRSWMRRKLRTGRLSSPRTSGTWLGAGAVSCGGCGCPALEGRSSDPSCSELLAGVGEAGGHSFKIPGGWAAGGAGDPVSFGVPLPPAAVEVSLLVCSANGM